jgi:hypothetical protein
MTLNQVALKIPSLIETPDQALRWAEEMVIACETARSRCDAPLDVQAKNTVRELRRRETRYLIHHGNALGVISALMRVGLIETTAYNIFVSRVQKTLIGSTVASIDG